MKGFAWQLTKLQSQEYFGPIRHQLLPDYFDRKKRTLSEDVLIVEGQSQLFNY